MVKTFSTITVFLVTIAAVKAQGTINIADYPPVNAVPPVNSPQVQAWLKEIDLTGAPAIAKTTAPKGSPPACKVPADPNACVWTCDACPSTDITSCSLPNTWGLTFDDGPSVATPKLLDFLKTNKLSASFFLIGSNVIQFPQTVQREIAEGHHLASHTWSHTALTTLSNEEIVAEMKWTEKAVMAATGYRLKYMRPPYGDINNRVRFVLNKMGYIPVDWTGDDFDTNDWRIDNTTFKQADAVTKFSGSLDKYVAGPTKASSGFYCLEHDVSEKTVDAALALVPLGITRKINFANVGQCQKDATPYQTGSTAPMPTTTVPGATPGGSNSTNGGNSTSPNGPKVVGGTSSANSQAATLGFSAVAVIAAAAALL